MVVEKTREEFIVWIRLALNDRESGAYEELYQFLCSCFIRADVEKKGMVHLANFNQLIEEAAELPRLYGYAPKTSDLYPTEGLCTSARAKQFLDMDTEKIGYITLHQWIKFAINHIVGKLGQLPKDHLSGTDVTKAEFIAFVKKAVHKSTPEYRELYSFLLRTFQAGDKEGYGEVGPAEFDEMIECAAKAPRRFGLAPNTEDLFKSDADRLASRMKHFSVMDKHSTGKISFDEWLNYSMKHIIGKVKGL